MPKKQDKVRDALAEQLNSIEGKPAAKGGALCTLAIFLFTTLAGIPAEWKMWFQWPIFTVFLAGLARASVALLR